MKHRLLAALAAAVFLLQPALSLAGSFSGKDATGTSQNFKADGDGSSGTPYIPHHILTDGTNKVSFETAGADAASNTASHLAISSWLYGYNGTTWDRVRTGVTTAVSSFTGYLNTLPLAKYNSTPPSLSDGQSIILQANSSGALKVDGSAVTQPVSDGGGSLTVDGSVSIGSALPAGTNYVGKTRITDGTNDVTLKSLTNAKAVPTAIVDGNGDQITSFGGGTQYTDGNTQSTPTGTVALGKNGSNVLHALSLDGSGNLNVNVASGGGTGGTSSSFGSAFPSTGTAIGASDGTNMQSLKVDGSNNLLVKINAGGATQPVSGTVTANQGGAPWSDNITQVGGSSLALGQTTMSASLPVTLASNQSDLPSKTAQATATTGTFTNATQTTSITNSSVSGYPTVTVSINGTYGTATGVFEASDDAGTTWYGVDATRTDSNTIETGYTSLTNTSRMWVVPINGANQFRVRSTAVASGTANIRITPTGAITADATVVSIGSALPTGSNVIGALSANQSVNVAQLAGTTTDTNSGNKSAGTLRVVLATDQPQLTNKLLVTPDANSAINVAQVNGGTTATVATGVQKVGIADSGGTAFLSAANALNSTGGGIQAAQVVGQFDDTSPTSITENQFGNLRMSANRNAYTTIRDAAGNERGVNVNASNQLSVSVDNTPAVSQSGTWTVQPGNTANTTPWLVSEQAATSGGVSLTKVISAASTNATSVKASAGQVYMITASNINASPRYLKLYNKASSPTVGTDTPVLVFLIPGNTSGTGTNIPVPSCGLAFGTGIALAITTGVADNDTGAVAANDIVVNIGYK